MVSKGRILVVEDDFDISNMLRIYFSGQGYDVQVAPRGGDALTLTRKQMPQLIVLDIMLPDMDGYAVCRELRQTTRTSHIPIIFLTQKDERGTPDDFVGHAGNDNFVLITYSPKYQVVSDKIVSRFDEEVKQHYSFIDRERGHIVLENGQEKPLMTLGAGSVSNATQQFADIREITELAAEARRRPAGESSQPIETAW